MRTQFSDAASSAVVGGPEPALQIDRSSGALLTTGAGSGGSTPSTAPAIDDATTMAYSAVEADVDAVTGATLGALAGAEGFSQPVWVREVVINSPADNTDNLILKIGAVEVTRFGPEQGYQFKGAPGGIFTLDSITVIAESGTQTVQFTFLR